MYTVSRHCSLTGSGIRSVAEERRHAIASAEAAMRTGDYLWVDVWQTIRGGVLRSVWHKEREATPAERMAILGRYTQSKESAS